MGIWVGEDEEGEKCEGEKESERSTGFREAKTDGCSRVCFTNVNNL